MLDVDVDADVDITDTGTLSTAGFPSSLLSRTTFRFIGRCNTSATDTATELLGKDEVDDAGSGALGATSWTPSSAPEELMVTVGVDGADAADWAAIGEADWMGMDKANWLATDEADW